MRVDDEAGDVGEGGEGGAGVDTDRGHDDLPGDDGHGQNGAVGRGGHAGFGDAVVDGFEAALGALQGVLGQAVIGIEVLVDFLADQFGLEQLAGAAEVAGQLFHRDPGAVDLDLGRSALDLQVAVVNDKEEVALFHYLSGRGMGLAQFAADFRFDLDLESRGDVAAEPDFLADVAPLGLRGGNIAFRRRVLFATSGRAEEHDDHGEAAERAGGCSHHIGQGKALHSGPMREVKTTQCGGHRNNTKIKRTGQRSRRFRRLLSMVGVLCTKAMAAGESDFFHSLTT